MVPTPTPHVNKVFETSHMLWMSRWIHHHATINVLVGTEIRELDVFFGHRSQVAGHREATNDVKVD
jgi:phosphopentomutase